MRRQRRYDSPRACQECRIPRIDTSSHRPQSPWSRPRRNVHPPGAPRAPSYQPRAGPAGPASIGQARAQLHVGAVVRHRRPDNLRRASNGHRLFDVDGTRHQTALWIRRLRLSVVTSTQDRCPSSDGLTPNRGKQPDLPIGSAHDERRFDPATFMTTIGRRAGAWVRVERPWSAHRRRRGWFR